MLARIRGEQQGDAFEVFVVAQAVQWRTGGHLVLAQQVNQADRHLGLEKTRANRVDGDVVVAPFRRQRAGEVDHRAFGRVVSDGLHALRVAVQPGNGGDVDDAPALVRNHAVFGEVLAQNEIAAHIEVHHLVPGRHRVVFGGRAPAGPGVVDQNIYPSHALQRFIGEAANVFFFAAVGGGPARVNACGLQLDGSLLQVFRFARVEHDAGTSLTQRMGHLQTQATRAAGDEGSFSFEVKQLLDGTGHGVSPGGMVSSALCIGKSSLDVPNVTREIAHPAQG